MISEEDAVITTEIVADQTGEITITRVDQWIERIRTIHPAAWFTAAGALLFGLFDAYQLRLQQLAGAFVPYQVFLMLPYILSIIALIVMSRRAAYPRALMVPYRRGER